MSRELDEFTVAARICKILEAAATDEAEVEKQVRAAMAKKRAARQEEINGLLLRCPEDRREHVAKLILTRGLPLNGFELGAANDARSDDVQSDVNEGIANAIPEALRGDAPPLRPGERLAVERKTGAGRQ
jgi:hypothetical protein